MTDISLTIGNILESFVGPLIAVFIPGIFIGYSRALSLPVRGAYAILISLSVTTVSTLTLSVLHLNVLWHIAVLFVLIAMMYKQALHGLIKNLPVIVISLCLVASLSVPYFLRLSGLPTGDSQKALLWAREIIVSKQLPQYDRSRELLNRDPFDFYTPGLHTLTAFVWAASNGTIASVGMLSLFVAIGIAWIASSITTSLLMNFAVQYRAIGAIVAAFLTLTNIRFLRYIREPGYHFQNLVGEFFLIGLIFLTLRLVKKWSYRDAILAILCAVSLLTTHQFSSFIGAVVGIIAGIAIIYLRWNDVRGFLSRKRSRVWILTALAGIFIGALLFLSPIPAKLQDIFSLKPHLVSQTPSILDYPNILGTTWFLLGIGGLIIVLSKVRSSRYMLFMLYPVSILALSQGPRMYLDIPPVRALLTVVVPLSICGSLCVVYLITSASHRKITAFVYATIILIMSVVSVSHSYSSSSTALSTNSTVTPQLIKLAKAISIEHSPNVVLIDDYNKRAASWLVLSGNPMVTRIAADIRQQMRESIQSEQRSQIYRNLLDYEKIFALGSNPIIVNLLNRHLIGYVTGIQDTSETSFSNNPALKEFAREDTVILFKPIQRIPPPTDLDEWLLRSTTLANDIGDKEDSFKHLQASVRTPRLGAPMISENTTYRTTTSARIPIVFNVGAYTQVLWDGDDNALPDGRLQFVIKELNKSRELSVELDTGAQFTPGPDGFYEIPGSVVPIDEKGFITLTLLNPDEFPIDIDLVALGLVS